MHFIMTDIQHIYRNSHTGSPRDAIRPVHRLGAVWYAGFEHLVAPRPSHPDAPWMQIVVVPRALTDGIEDCIIIADAELSLHGLAWRLDAPENRDNVFVRVGRAVASQVDLHRLSAPWRIDGCVRNPLGAARFCP